MSTSAPVLTLSTASRSNVFISSSSTPQQPSTPDAHNAHINALVALSRNASVISSSSSSSSSSSLAPPRRPHPPRTFSKDSDTTTRPPMSPSLAAAQPRSPTTPTRMSAIPAAYLPRALSPDGAPIRLGANGLPSPAPSRPASRQASRARSRSNSAAAQRVISADDFEFGEVLGSGAYSSVSGFGYLGPHPFLSTSIVDTTSFDFLPCSARRVAEYLTSD